MTQIDQYLHLWAPRVLGRVFTHDGIMHLVLDVDMDGGLCRVSRRAGRETEVIHMPMGEVVLRLTGIEE